MDDGSKTARTFRQRQTGAASSHALKIGSTVVGEPDRKMPSTGRSNTKRLNSALVTGDGDQIASTRPPVPTNRVPTKRGNGSRVTEAHTGADEGSLAEFLEPIWSI